MTKRSLTVKTKIYAITAIFSLIIVALGAFSLNQISAAKKAFTHYSELAVAIEKQTLMITADMNYVSRLNRSIILGGNHQQDIAAMKKRVATIYSYYDEMKAIAERWPSEQVAQHLQNLIAATYKPTKNSLDGSIHIMQRLSVSSSDADRQGAWARYSREITPQAQEARKHYKVLSQYIDEQGKSIYQHSTDTVEQAHVVIISATTLAIVIGALLGWLITRSIINPLQRLASTAKEVEEHARLYLRSGLTSDDELGTVGRAVDDLLSSFERTILSIKSAADQLTQSSHYLAENSTNTNTSVANQQRETDMVATAMTEMASTAQEISRSAADTATGADRANKQSISGQGIVDNTIENINALAQEIRQSAVVIEKVSSDSEEIGRILDVIGGIAEQTNLLALNAAIEAARAGEQGRGFAVVADEVRTLASRTNESTQEIKEMIDSLQNGSKTAVQAMVKSQQQADQTVNIAKDAGTALTEITLAVSQINDMAAQIATAAEQQTTVNEEISRNINNITLASQETAFEATNTQQASESLSILAQGLHQQVEQFECKS